VQRFSKADGYTEVSPESARSPHHFASRPVDRRIAGADLELHYLDWGGEGHREILFLHGGGLTAHTWDVVCDVLHARYRCLSVDLRGHGDSEWSSDGRYLVEDHVADIERVVAGLRLSQFVLAGMSLGGTAGLLYAGSKPKGLVGLVLVDTGYGLRTPGARVREFMSGPAEADFEDFVERAAAFNPRRSREQLRRSLRKSLRELPDGRWAWKYDPRTLSPAVDIESLRGKLTAAAKEVDCPTLVLRGGESDMFHDEDAAALAALIPEGRWRRIDGAGHTIQGDRPQELAQALVEFVDALPPRTATV
jgi:esterase